MVDLIRKRWDHRQIADLLACQDCDARKVAALACGLVGTKCCLEKLVPLLRDPDAVVAQMAEHAMWSVWFRSGTADANHQLCRGTRALERGDTEHAIEHFSRAITLDPEFAEAYNQRAIAKFLLERYSDCVDDCRMAVQLMPFHFGAWAGLGHCHAHDGRLVPALKCYEKALTINPHLDDIRQTVDELRDRLCIERKRDCE